MGGWESGKISKKMITVFLSFRIFIDTFLTTLFFYYLSDALISPQCLFAQIIEENNVPASVHRLDN